MADIHAADIYLQPHITKYLYFKLNAATRRHTPHGDTIAAELLDILRPSMHLLESQPEDRKGKPHGKLRVMLRLSDQGDLTARANELVDQYARRQYFHEFTRFVDREYYSHRYAGKTMAILAFRSLYGITEDDLPLQTSVKMYYRYERARMRQLERLGSRNRPAKKPKRR
jgi:hypothetical protein